jgi:hypothetical protein
MNSKTITMLVIFCVILTFGIIFPIIYFKNKTLNESSIKLELVIMSALIISWVGLFTNSIINKYMDN